jgi:deazaflavin-dependent oxidoreductase (nitroreductase family)
MRLLNVPMRIVLGAPFATPLGGRLMLATITGRRSGRIYRQPMSYVRDGDTLLTPGGGRWTLNLVDGPRVPIRLRGKDIVARPELVADPEEVQRLLATITTANSGAKRFIAIPTDANGRFDDARLQTAIRYGFRIVVWHPEAAGQETA